MKAIVWNKYGSADYLEYKDVKKPQIKDNEVLIEVHASTVTAGDCEIRSLKFSFLMRTLMRLYFGFLRPKDRILGQELSGLVKEVGKNVNKFKVGDAVMGTPGFKFGGYGEYLALSEKDSMGVLVKKPEAMSFKEAAALPVGGMEANHILKATQVSKGSNILIVGAGGSIGTMVIQMAKHLNAFVTAIDSEEKLPMLTRLGADQVLDYKTTDYTKLEAKYDVVIDIIGKSKIKGTFDSLYRNGTYLVANPKRRHKIIAKLTKGSRGKRMVVDNAVHTEKSMYELIDLYKEGLLKIEIDQVFSLKEVAKAHKYVESGRKKGNVLIQVKETYESDNSI